MDAAMNAAERQIVGKVEVIYSDPIVDTSVTINVSEENSKSSTSQLADGIGEPSYKWFSFRENKLDGSCHFIPEAKDEEIGWWSEQVSCATAKEYVTKKFNDIVGAANVKRMIFFDPTTGKVLADESGNANASISVDAALLDPDTEGSAGILNIKPINTVINGNFNGNVAGWSALEGTSTIAYDTGKLKSTGTGTYNLVDAGQNISLTMVVGRKYYFRMKATAVSGSCTELLFRCIPGTGSNFSPAIQSNPVTGQEYTISAVFTSTNQSGTCQVRVRHSYVNAATANGKIATFDEIMVIDLTEKYGAGNEPDKATMDALITQYGWFDQTHWELPNIYNSVSNGNFTSTTGWTASGSTLGAASNTLSVTGSGGNASAQARQTTIISATPERKVYARCLARVTNAVSTIIGVNGYGSGGGASVVFNSQATPVQNQWYTLSGVGTVPSGSSGSLVMQIYENYADAATANGKVMEVKEALMIDLTYVYGAGNEPSAATMDALITSNGWFDNSLDDSLSFGNGGTDSAMSIVTCINPNTATATQSIFSKLDTTTSFTKLEYFFERTSTNTLRLGLYNAAGARIGRATNSSAFTNGVYNTLISTYNGNKTNAGIKLYVNAVQSDTADYAGGSYTGMSNTGAKVGNYTLDNSGNKQQLGSYKGAFIAIVGIELTQQQVTDITTLMDEYLTLLNYGFGKFVTAPTIEVGFDPKAVGVVSVTGDALLSNYPVDFDVELYDGASLIYTHQVVDNATPNYLSAIPIQLDITSMKLIIYSINVASVAAKIIEFYTTIRETYTNDDLITMDILEEIYYDTDGIPLGAVSSNELDFVLDNFSRKFTPGNADSLIQNYMKKFRYVTPYLGYISNGVTTWFKMGKYFTVQWKPNEENSTVGVVCFDRLEMLKNTSMNTSEVYVEYSYGQLYDILLADAGLDPADYVIDDTFYYVFVPYAWFDKASHRANLQMLAEASIAFIYIDRQNRIVITKGKPSNTSTIEYTDDVNVIAKRFPSKLAEVTNYVEVEAQPLIVTANTQLYQHPEVFYLPIGGSIDLECVFSTTPAMSVDSYNIVSNYTVTVDSITTYAWGAIVSLSNPGTVPVTITELTLTGTYLAKGNVILKTAKDDASIIADGKISTRVTHRFIQTSVQADQTAQELLYSYLTSRKDVEISSRGDLSILLQDRVTVRDAITDALQDYMMLRQDIKYDGALEIAIVGRYIDAEFNKTHMYLTGYTHNQLNAYTHDEIKGGI